MAEPAVTAPESSNVTRIESGDREIFIVGTAHISRRSVDEVRCVIEEVRPDTVCVELDQTRYDALVDDSRWRRLDIFEVIRQDKMLFFLATLVLTAYQKKLGDKLGVRPGAEMLAAVEAARGVGARVVLADRDVQATLKRSFRSLSFWNKSKLLAVLIGAFFATEEITEEQIEQLKDRDTLSELMKAFAQEMPELQVPLIDERDRYLMSSVEEAPGRRIVAIVGAGHVEGMQRYLGQKVNREALTVIPPPSKVTAALKWLIPVVVLGAFYFGYQGHQGERLLQMVMAWVLPTSISCALFGVIAGATWPTVLTALFAAPITTLNPAIAAGMFTGFVEAWVRRPTVEDCERINQDMTTIRGMYRNRFTRVLLVAVATTLGAALGAWIGVTWVVTLL